MNKILIIDDDRELCALIKRSVQAENIEADFCNTGKEGLPCEYLETENSGIISCSTFASANIQTRKEYDYPKIIARDSGIL